MKTALWIIATLLAVGGWILSTQGGFAIHCTDCLFFQRHRHGSLERNASASLKTLATAEADFRGNDRDGDGTLEFWRGDVAGLYTLAPTGRAEPIKLIELSVAAADDRPVTPIAAFATRGPKSGYWFRAIRKKASLRSRPPPSSPSAPSPPSTRSPTDGPTSSTRGTRSSRPTSATAAASRNSRRTRSSGVAGPGWTNP